MKTFCGYYNENICRSCTLLETPYPEQLRLKEESLLSALGISKSILLDTTPSPSIHFRNKAKFSVTGTLDTPIIGLTGDNNLDQGREVLDCSLHHPLINETAKSLISVIQTARLTPYSIEARKGELKGLILFYSETSNQMYLRFVLRSKESIDRIKKHIAPWLQERPFVQCVSANIQPLPHAILEGEEEVFLTEKKFIDLNLGHIMLKLTPKAFVQTNQQVALKLYEETSHWIRDLKTNKFMELFCGQGAFSFFARPFVSEALGVEINAEAIKQAQETALSFGFKNLSFLAKDAKDVSLEIKRFSPDVLLVNPPRRGLGESLKLIQESKVKSIIYSSCSVETLAKDIESLTASYTVKKAKIFDMFPHTKHFETLVLLELNAF